MILAAAAAFALAASTGCGPWLVWHGRSPDRRHTVRVVEDGGQSVVRDGVAGAAYDAIGLRALIFSPNSRHLAYAARRDGRWHLVIDGREGRGWEGIGEVVWSPDSRRVAYAAEDGERWRVVVVAGGREAIGAPARGLQARTLRFNADGSQHGYVVTTRGGARAVIGEQVGPVYRRVAWLTLAPRGGRFGYAAQRSRSWHAVIDGVEGPPLVRAAAIAFDASGEHVAYAAELPGDTAMMVVDGSTEGARYRAVRAPVFRPGASLPTFAAQRTDGRFLVVHEGQEGPPFDEVRDPVFSADGSRWAYVAVADRHWILVVDGTPGAPTTWIGDPAFSRDGRRIAYAARRGRRMAVIVDDAVHAFDVVIEGTVVFDATGRHWGCLAGVEAERRFHLVVDGVRTRRFDVGETVEAALRASPPGELIPDDGVRDFLRSWVAAEMSRRTR